MKIYIATYGEYSDYQIEAVFTDKNQAELFCATHEYFLEEYESDQIKIEAKKKPKRIWNMEIRGARFEFWTKDVMTFSDIEDFSNYIKTISLDSDVEEETAKKIMCDKYYKWIAENKI